MNRNYWNTDFGYYKDGEIYAGSIKSAEQGMQEYLREPFYSRKLFKKTYFHAQLDWKRP